MNNRQRNYCVLMFPWLAHGHVFPFLELTKKFTKRSNFYIYFCSTPAILDSIKLSDNFSLSIQLIELHLPSLPELPPHYHTTKGLPLHLMPTLKKAFDMASSSFFNILKNVNPDLLIYDFIQPWAPTLALSLNIPSVLFLTSSATMGGFLFHTFEKTPSEDDGEFPFSSIFIHEYMKPKFSHLVDSSSNGIKDKDKFLQCCDSSCNVILIKTFRDLQGKYIDYLSVLMKKKLVPVGPLVEDPVEEDDHEEGIEIIQWLDKKERSSTVFVSFGSEYFLPKEEMEGIALGFWGIGGFVSHCGWSSVMESMKLGVPIIAMPMHLDQPLNARLVEDVGVGMEVRRNENGRIEREEMARVIKEVVVEKNGEKLRRKAREMSENIRKKGDEEIDEVVDELSQLSG
ncbi:hypothetical protein WN943_018864 [Citrus x changshan-huyou]